MKVVLIGLGSIGRKQVDALSKLNTYDFDIYALRSSKSAEGFPKVTNIYDLNNLEFEPDFFIISNPTNLHFNSIQSVLPFGKPIFMETPAVMTVEEGLALANAFFKKPVLNYTACNFRFLEVLIFAKDFLQKNDLRINEVNIYAGSYLPDWKPHMDYQKSYNAHTEMGGGIHLDFIQEVDYLYWFFGKPTNTKKFLRSKSSLGISAVDYANFIFVYDQFVASVVLNYYRKDKKRSFEVITDKGTLSIDIETGMVRFDQKIIFFTDQTILDTYTSQMEYFLNCIQSNTKPTNCFDEAFEVMKMCLGDEN